MKVCPICGKPYKDYSAISRKDGITEICPDCGLDEAIKCFVYNYDIQTDIKEIKHIKEKPKR